MTKEVQNSRTFWQQAGIDTPVILASGSPRRAELLTKIGLPFEIIVPAIHEEKYDEWDDGKRLLQYAVDKAAAVKTLHPDRSILAADTVVRKGQKVFGKPANKDDAVQMLMELSGQMHEVWTAVCFLRSSETTPKTLMASTEVEFRSLKDSEISTYVASGEPLDKAGAYGIQGIGGLWVTRINGCYFNVVGLPISKLWDLLLT